MHQVYRQHPQQQLVPKQALQRILVLQILPSILLLQHIMSTHQW
jgi:hypothetical protein